VTTHTGTVTRALDEAPRPRSIGVECARRVGDDAQYVEVVVERLLAAARSGARVVWIRNTVREAQRAFEAVVHRAEGVPHLLFHARFRGCDRTKIEESVLEQWGKNGEAGGRLLIATQVVEQSLDIDFDELHTDLAPIDLVLQRAGRLHRHRRERPRGFEWPLLVVHAPSESEVAELRFGPSRYVYDVGTLWITQRQLRGRTSMELPNDIRPLVEECYHPAARAALLALGGRELLEAEGRRQDQLAARRTRAIQCCIPRASADPIGADALDDDEDAVQAFTRDGTSTTLLPFWWDGQGARDLDSGADDPKWGLEPASSGASRLASALLDQTVSLPARGDAEGRPEAQSRAWEAWKTRFAQFAEDAGLGRRIVPLPLVRMGGGHGGRLRLDGRERPVVYDGRLGLFMPSEKDEEQER
jgi:hypothetical protein